MVPILPYVYTFSPFYRFARLAFVIQRDKMLRVNAVQANSTHAHARTTFPFVGCYRRSTAYTVSCAIGAMSAHHK